ncbi:CYTH domain-containing protein [Roseomonas fluvialis]|uniref:CYTH domain-containing protein n=1 Tax=Roseomonas fluvialis TaxID=1750527 RepID=A0ABM7Y913_9PROT|nr:CYTH domain-containing protein [Roseomonas fluvialis]BDG74531.1 CYTH domain-containing protein [Roseomonas fluvialis]
MAFEIERRFLVQGEAWRTDVTTTRHLRQGYLAREDGVSVRVRVAGDAARLTIKGPGGLVRREFEYDIPARDAEDMLALLCAGRSLRKTRHEVPLDGLVWEVDVFEGALAGLVVAEVELPAADHPLRVPAWAGREITADPRYANAALASATAPPRG